MGKKQKTPVQSEWWMTTAWVALKPEIGSRTCLLLNILQANTMEMGETFVFLRKC